MADRIVGIRVPLTKEQEERLNGSETAVYNVVVVGRTDSDAPLENEVRSGVDEALVHAIYEENRRYQSAVETDEVASRSSYAHGSERPPAVLAFLTATAEIPRAAGIRVPLAPSQRRMIKEATGADVSEAIFIGSTASQRPLRNEITWGLNLAVVHALAQNQDRFIAAIENDRAAKESEWLARGSADREPPTLGFVH
jgi:hypothetical protein